MRASVLAALVDFALRDVHSSPPSAFMDGGVAISLSVVGFVSFAFLLLFLFFLLTLGPSFIVYHVALVSCDLHLALGREHASNNLKVFAVAAWNASI